MDREYNYYNIYYLAEIPLIALFLSGTIYILLKFRFVAFDNIDSAAISNIMELLFFKTQAAAVHAD